jgi:hypothetical protein
LRRSRKPQVQRKTLPLFDRTLSLFEVADFRENRVKPEGNEGGLRGILAQSKEAIRDDTVSVLLETKSILMKQVVSPGNMRASLRRVEQSEGAAGIDGMAVKQLRRPDIEI